MYRYESPRLLAAQALLNGVLSPKVFDLILIGFPEYNEETTLANYYDLVFGQCIVPYILNNSLRARSVEDSICFRPKILAGKYWGIKISPPMSQDFDLYKTASDFIKALSFPFKTYLANPLPLSEARKSLFNISVVDPYISPAELQFYLSSLRKPH